MDVFVLIHVTGSMTNCQFSARNAHLDAHLVLVALTMVLMRRRDVDMTTGNCVVELFELLDMFAHVPGGAGVGRQQAVDLVWIEGGILDRGERRRQDGRSVEVGHDVARDRECMAVVGSVRCV